MLIPRIFFLLLAILILGTGGLYFASSDSYQNSFKARYYYFLNDYEKANEYSQQAYKQDKYNKMAFSVLTQSKNALSYQHYITRGEKYMEKINQISSHSKITKADRAKIKMMSEIMLGEYKNLVSTKLTDKKLLENAKNTYKKYKQINNELF